MSDNKLQVFQHHSFGLVRVVEHDNEPWFLAADICLALGLGNTTEALRNLDPDERASEKLRAGTRFQDFNIISESGMYTLIMRSNKPEAKAFRKWVTKEVLPSIRKTGGYSTCSTEDLVAKTIGNPDWAIQMLTAFKEEQEKRKNAEQERDEAVRAKAHISTKREATIIGKLSAKSNECKKLREENTSLKQQLGIEVEEEKYKSLKDTPWIKEVFEKSSNLNTYIAYQLKNIVRKLKLDVKHSDDKKTVLYPIEALNVLREKVEHGEIRALEKFKK